MPSNATRPHGAPIEIDRVNLCGAKADLVKGVVRLTFDLPLNVETIALRQQLQVLALSDDYMVALTIQPLQLSLALVPNGQTE